MVSSRTMRRVLNFNETYMRFTERFFFVIGKLLLIRNVTDKGFDSVAGSQRKNNV